MNDILVKSITRGRKVEPIRLYLRRDQYASLWAGFRQRIIPCDSSVLSNLTVTSHLPTHTLARIIYVIKLCSCRCNLSLFTSHSRQLCFAADLIDLKNS